MTDPPTHVNDRISRICLAKTIQLYDRIGTKIELANMRASCTSNPNLERIRNMNQQSGIYIH